MDKCPGVRPIGVASTWDRLIPKCALTATGLDAKTACGSRQLYAGLEAGIDGAVHAVLKKAEQDGSMLFGNGEVDTDRSE